VNMEDAIKRAMMDLYSKYIDAPRCAETRAKHKKEGVLLMHRDDYKEMIDNGGGEYQRRKEEMKDFKREYERDYGQDSYRTHGKMATR